MTTHRGGPVSPRLIAVLLAAIVVGLFGVACSLRLPGQPEAPFNGGALEPPRALSALSLDRVDGKPWTEGATRGRLSLLFFGYTFCPDVCPTTLLEVADIRQHLGAAANAVDFYFVTVDPDRDTADVLSAYVARYDPKIIGLRGDDERTELVKSAFGVISEKRPIATASLGGYAVDHTAGMFLVDREAAIRLVYPFGTPTEAIVADLQRLGAR